MMTKRLISHPSRRAVMAAVAAFAMANSAVARTPMPAPAQLRLLQGGVSGPAGHYLVGLEITLAPGFKTYWRHPGDTGVPPQFDFSASQNVKRADVHFPAPIRFADGAGGHSFGYAGPIVVLPVTVEAMDPTQPVVLRIKADYAVCEKICIPMNGAIDATMALKPEGQALQAIQRAMARVPVKTTLGPRNGLAILKLERGTASQAVIARLGATPAAADIFVEAEQPWFFESRRAASDAFEITALERSKAADCTGVEITMTLVTGEAAIEVSTWLDVALLQP